MKLDETKIIEVLKKHPITKKLFKDEEEQEELKEKRIKAAQEIERLEKEQTEVLPSLETEINQCEKEFVEAKELLNDKKKQLNNAIRNHRNVKWNTIDRIKKQRRFLKQTAPPELKEKKEQLKEKLEVLRQTPITNKPVEEPPKEGYIRPDIRPRTYISNKEELDEEEKKIMKEIDEIDYQILHPEEVLK